MRKSLVLTALLVLSLSMLAAAADRPTMGPRLGLNVANFNGDDAEGLDPRVGACLGGFIEYPLTPIISLQGEVLYTMKGAMESSMGIDLVWKMNYVEVPLLARLNFPISGSIRPYLLAGPGIAFNTGAEWEVSGFGQSASMDIGDYVKGTDLGAVLGGGLSFPVGPYWMAAEVRYEFGMATIDEDLVPFLEEVSGEDLPMDELDLKNGTFSVVVGLAF
jgi:hypothetical protein